MPEKDRELRREDEVVREEADRRSSSVDDRTRCIWPRSDDDEEGEGEMVGVGAEGMDWRREGLNPLIP